MQNIGADAPAFERAGAKIFHQDIGRRGEVLQDVLAFRLAQVQRQRRLVASDNGPIQADTILLGCAPASRRVRHSGRFDLDDFRTKVSE